MFNQNRTIGFELEGYVDENPYDVVIPYADVGSDGSLRNSDWNDRWDDDDEDEEVNSLADYGVEIRTEPLNSVVETMPNVFGAMQAAGWHTDNSAGTHIHVDLSDFTAYDKFKLVRFGKGIEKIMFAMVNDYRFDNGYCGKISSGWRKLFWRRGPYRSFNFNARSDDDLYGDFCRAHDLRNGRNHWLNVFGSNYNTVEFRIFHAAESAEELIWQAQMAHNIVELVKNSTVEQINFIIKSLYESVSSNEAIAKFCDLLEIDGRQPKGHRAMQKLDAVINGTSQQVAGATATTYSEVDELAISDVWGA